MRLVSLTAALSSAVACAPGAIVVEGDPTGDVIVEPAEDTSGEALDVPRALVLTDLMAYEPSAWDGLSPGDTVRVDVRLVNPTAEGWYEYPGVVLETEPPLVDPTTTWYGFYGILPRSSLAASFEFVIPADFEGDTLLVRTRMVPLDAAFTGGDAIAIEVPID